FVNAPNNQFIAFSGADGTFSSPAAPGQVAILGNGLFGYSTPADQTVQVVAGLNTGGIVLTYGHGILTGFVRDQNGNPLSDVLVTDSGALQASALTKADGSYVLKVGRGDNTIAVQELEGLTSPASFDLPFFDTPGPVGTHDFTY